MAGVEVALFFAIQSGLHRGMIWPQTMMAVLAAVLLGLGVLEQYLAIWKNRSVEGISFLFCGIDALGDVTSIVSVAFEPTINIVGFVMYGAEFVLWCGVFTCGFWFKWIPWLKIRMEDIRKAYIRDQGPASTHERTVTTQDIPSSTSVFRTASNDLELRERHVQHTACHLDSLHATVLNA